MRFTTRLIDQYLTALRTGDELEIARIEAVAADYDAHNPDSRLLDELEALRIPVAA
ncbi:hypothetical protein [Streptomyces lavendofoliae]|uniref:Uncharacterized protein n=1 Tax=Streptomyces lavendofoliae TaxID=67314 RepID=A0A918I0G3_9ACTN|nr:hypothetical protein [Streptomyces lavendofoliae]GGU52407.1 hypothetical protein GCM10010274_46660 [Streptomyces lavendofoliae]